MRLDVGPARMAAAALALAAAAVAWLASPALREAVRSALAPFGSADPRDAALALRSWILGFGAWAPLASAAAMILQAVVAPLPAFVVTLANGLAFGWLPGAALSWSSAMAGAALCFWISRSLGRPAVERLLGGAAALDSADRFFRRHGTLAVLLARLLPFVPFDAVSYGAGLTTTGFWPFLAATGIGQLPATLLYSWMGERAVAAPGELPWLLALAAVLLLAGWVLADRLRGRDAPAGGGGAP